MTDFLSFFPTVVILVALFTALVGRLWMHKATLRNTWHFLFTAILLVIASITNSNDTFFIVAFYILAISLTYELLLLLQGLIKSLTQGQTLLEGSNDLNKSLKKMSKLLSSELYDGVEQLQEVSQNIIAFETSRSEERLKFAQSQLAERTSELNIHSSLNRTVVDTLLATLTISNKRRESDQNCQHIFDMIRFSLMNINASLIMDNDVPFNHLRHDRIDFVPCSDQQQANLIAEIVQPGLIYQGKIIQRARVMVFQYTVPPKPEPAPQPVETVVAQDEPTSENTTTSDEGLTVSEPTSEDTATQSIDATSSTDLSDNADTEIEPQPESGDSIGSIPDDDTSK